MNHKPDVFLVDSHPKSYSSDDDLQLVLHPLLLNHLSLLVTKFCMIVVTPNLIVSLEDLAQLFTLFSTGAVNYSTLVPESSPEHMNQVIVDVLELLLVSDLVKQVGSVERFLERDYVLLDL